MEGCEGLYRWIAPWESAAPGYGVSVRQHTSSCLDRQRHISSRGAPATCFYSIFDPASIQYTTHLSIKMHCSLISSVAILTLALSASAGPIAVQGHVNATANVDESADPDLCCQPISYVLSCSSPMATRYCASSPQNYRCVGGTLKKDITDPTCENSAGGKNGCICKIA